MSWCWQGCAARAVEEFSKSLRMEMDLHDLSGHLVRVVDETLAPDHVSLWFVKNGQPEKKRASSEAAESRGEP